MSLNGGYAMIKYNSTQEELQIAYRSKKPALFYDENQRAHWAVIEETATESVDEETQEPITIYEYSYRLLDDAGVVANPTLDGTEADLTGLEVDGTKYKVGGGSEVHLYQHIIKFLNGIGYVYAKYYDNVETPYTQSTFVEKYGVKGADIPTSTEVQNGNILYKCQFQDGNYYNIVIYYITTSDSTPKMDFVNVFSDIVTQIF